MRRDYLTFIHAPAFDESLADIPMADEELRSLQEALQDDPEAGDTVPGTGGVRKVRVAVKGKGKRGGARVLYYYVVQRQTVYLLLAYDKSEAENISEAGKKLLKKLAAALDTE